MRWKSSFLEKHGEANLQVVNGKDLKWRDLLDEIRSAPFLGEKRLVIVEGLPTKITKEDLEKLKTEIHPSTILAFVESSPDKRKTIAKFLGKEATVRGFFPSTKNQLTTWVIQIAKEQGVSIDPPVTNHLVEVVGNDQWHLKNELLKLISYTGIDSDSCLPAGRQGPTVEEVDKVCLPSQKHTIWILSDLIGKGKTKEAVTFCKTLHESGEDAYSLWNIFLWITKNVATLWFWDKEKNLPIGTLSKESGVPFPSAQSLLPYVKNLSDDKFKGIVASVVKADEDLKTGNIKATVAEPIELITMLERQLLMMS